MRTGGQLFTFLTSQIVLPSWLLLVLMWDVTLFGQVPASTPIDVVLVIDNSKSMRTNDPQRLMIPALRAFAARLPSNTVIGVVVFDRTARIALDLTSLSGSAFADRFSDALKKIDYSGQWTDIAGGIERGVYEIRSVGRTSKEARRAIVLFTDGAIDLGSREANKDRTAWLNGALTGEAVREQIAVFGIAFTYTADFQLIHTLSTNTGGLPFLIDTPARIAPVFADIATALQRPRLPTDHPNPQSIPPSAQVKPVWLLYLAGGFLAAVLAAGGYFLYARLSSPSESATLTEVGRTSQTYRISKRVFRVGRKTRVRLSQIDLVIPDEKRKMVGRFQAEIRYRQGQFYLRDKHSINGTSVSEGKSTRLRKLKPGETVLLSDGAHIAFPGYEYVFGSSAPDLRKGESDQTNKEGGTGPALAQCHRCNGHFDPASLEKWKNFTVCHECRAKIDELDDTAANSLIQEMEEALRNKTTDRA